MDKETLRRYWMKLPARWRQILTWAGMAGALMLFVNFLSPAPEPEPTKRTTPDRVRNVLSVGNPRNVGVDALSAQIGDVAKAVQTQTQETQRLRGDLARVEKVVGALSPEGVYSLERKFDDIDQRMRAMEDLRSVAPATGEGLIGTPLPPPAAGPAAEPAAPKQGGQSAVTEKADEGKVDARSSKLVPGGTEDLRSLFPGGIGAGKGAGGREPTPPPANSGAATGAGQTGANPPANQQLAMAPPSNAPTVAPIAIKTVVEEAPKSRNDASSRQPGFTYFLPAGSLTKVTLLTGVDVPTGQQARKNPFPALARVTSETRLPNRMRVDLQDCVVLLSGYGDLSSSRAMFRGETMSCMRSDGLVMESRFPAYATGEDGRAGVRGRLVDKQGAVIGRALIAGFGQGVSQAFNVRPVPILQTAPVGGSQPYVGNFNENSLRSAAVMGTGSALDKIADHYLNMAADLYPVLEISAGREVDVIMSEGAKLEFKAVMTAADTAAARLIAAPAAGGKPGNGDNRRGAGEPGELPALRPSARQDEDPTSFFNLPSVGRK